MIIQAKKYYIVIALMFTVGFSFAQEPAKAYANGDTQALTPFDLFYLFTQNTSKVLQARLEIIKGDIQKQDLDTKSSEKIALLCRFVLLFEKSKAIEKNPGLMLKAIAEIEDILEKLKLSAQEQNQTIYISSKSIEGIFSACNLLKEKLSELVRPQSRDNLIQLMSLISTDKTQEIEICIKQCIKDNAFFFKEKVADKTILMHAVDPAKKATPEALKLIASHSDVNACTKEGFTALCAAIRFGNKDHVKALFDSNACVGVTTIIPLVIALEKGNDEITNMVMGKVIQLNDLTIKNSHLISARAWLLKHPTVENQKWLNSIVKMGRNLVNNELPQSRPDLALAVHLNHTIKVLTAQQKAQVSRPAQQVNAAAQAADVPELTAEETQWTKKNEKAQKEAKKEKQREALERAKAKQRESERAAQNRLAIACLPAAGAGAGATQSSSSTPDETAQAIAQRKASARAARAQLKKGFMLEPATAVAPIATTALATKEGNLRNQLNPLLRPHLIKASELMPKNGRMAPLGIITAYLHNAPCQASASNSK